MPAAGSLGLMASPDPATPRASRSPEITDYIAALAEPARSRLEVLREAISEEAPEAVERMSYAMPTWHQGENLVHLAGYAKHVGLYPGPAAIEAFADELRAFKTSRGAVQLPHDRELPLDLVRRIARWRVATVSAAPAKRQGRAPAALRDPGPIEFTDALKPAGSTSACFVSFPFDLKDTYGRGNLVPVEALWNDRVRYRGALAMMGGERAMLLCRKDILAELTKGPGDVVRVRVTLDLAPREAEIPEALAGALDASPEAKAAWEQLSPSCRREYARWIASAKRDETRAARVQKAIARVASGERAAPR